MNDNHKNTLNNKEKDKDKEVLAIYSIKLFDALSKGSDLQTLVDIGYDMLGNPFSIHDMSFKVIAYTPSSPVDDDPVWQEVISNQPSVESWTYYVSNKLFEMIAESDHPFFWEDPYCKYPRIVGKVMIGDKRVAGLTICAHQKPFTELDLELSALLCKAISIDMQKNKNIDYSRGLMHEDFLIDLLDEKLRHITDINDRIKILNLTFQKCLFVLTVDVSQFDITRFSLMYYRNELENKIPNCKAVVYDKKIVLLLSRDSEKQLFIHEMTQIKELFKMSNLFAGISRTFHNMVDIREYYLQSLEALKLGILLNPKAIIYRFDDYALYHLADICCRTERLNRTCHPSLLTLIDYDKKHGTDYAHSLETYIRCSKNVSESAAALNVHRNTMFFRIEKIESIMNIDLDDSNTVLHLHFSFKLLEISGIQIP
ncbi:helix-turn-helix domain-containing protein [Dehalobacter sp. DCM]|uniref:helix-turn-helix domain-containing protein n=1 Tax=Dehalobacter sp. DCM TaxID=2907827 RepID=UPI00308126F6|nr:helix-turn-helix domain-containing protein [Dehalobacter sp. DCM]